MPPGVFNPADFVSSKIFAEFIRSIGSLDGKHILDMGSGSGVVSIFAAAQGAECTAADINANAVDAIAINAKLNGLEKKINVIESDLFAKANGKFDIIFFNPPYYKGIPANDIERAFKGGDQLEVVTRFLNDAKDFLRENGVIYFIVSTDMDITDMNIKWLEGKFTSSHYHYVIQKEIKKFYETFYIYKLERLK